MLSQAPHLGIGFGSGWKSRFLDRRMDSSAVRVSKAPCSYIAIEELKTHDLKPL